MKTEPIANEEMLKNAMDDAEYDELARPPHAEVPRDHKLWPLISAAIREIYDPEIPVNVYELGLIYKIDVSEGEDGKHDLYVEMSLTSPACPVAQEMPGWVQGALFPIENHLPSLHCGRKKRHFGSSMSLQDSLPRPSRHCQRVHSPCCRSRREGY